MADNFIHKLKQTKKQTNNPPPQKQIAGSDTSFFFPASFLFPTVGC